MHKACRELQCLLEESRDEMDKMDTARAATEQPTPTTATNTGTTTPNVISEAELLVRLSLPSPDSRASAPSTTPCQQHPVRSHSKTNISDLRILFRMQVSRQEADGYYSNTLRWFRGSAVQISRLMTHPPGRCPRASAAGFAA